MAPTVTGLYCYPIKSCGGIALERANLSLRGLKYDREWAVIDMWTGKVLTQREEPKLCQVRTAIKDDVLEISAPYATTVHLPIASEDDASLRRRDVEVWGDSAASLDQGAYAGAWFSEFLGRDCAFVRMALDHVRPSKGGTRIAFADAHELLVVSEASLADLNGRLETPVPMDRFRPNIVVAGCAPYAEDAWHAVTIGGVRLLGADPCVRCVITTTDQATSDRGKEPLATLATYRKGKKKGVIFGRNFNGMNGGSLAVGDIVEIGSAP